MVTAWTHLNLALLVWIERDGELERLIWILDKVPRPECCRGKTRICSEMLVVVDGEHDLIRHFRRLD